ncbi:MAG: BlaI/MecI/CopY family transcriptional regulator [Planctomycetes bacterium]|nr:BlaI/MecI/CopY family transcriptional regulator [Planctomycetota bacterium]
MAQSKPNKKSEQIIFNAELTEAEWIIIRVVWENEPCATGAVQEALAPRKGLLGLELNDKRWPLVDIVPGMPAAKADLHNAGKILTVNHKDITYITMILITDVRSPKQIAVFYERKTKNKD